MDDVDVIINFNPILVLFKQSITPIFANSVAKFQSYISLIQASRSWTIQPPFPSFQSYISLIQAELLGELEPNNNFNPILVLFKHTAPTTKSVNIPTFQSYISLIQAYHKLQISKKNNTTFQSYISLIQALILNSVKSWSIQISILY